MRVGTAGGMLTVWGEPFLSLWSFGEALPSQAAGWVAFFIESWAFKTYLVPGFGRGVGKRHTRRSGIEGLSKLRCGFGRGGRKLEQSSKQCSLSKNQR